MIPAGCAASVGAGDQEREQYGIFIWKKEIGVCITGRRNTDGYHSSADPASFFQDDGRRLCH